MELILNEAHCQILLRELVPSARRFVWIATADIKDLHVPGPRGGKYRPFLGELAALVEQGVDVRLIHAKEPGPRFRADFDRYPVLRESDGFERVLCPRMHAKIIIVDGESAYVGSANLTGAGLGAKSPRRRNFEAGFLVRDPAALAELMAFLDALWIGDHCLGCGLRAVCPDPIA